MTRQLLVAQLCLHSAEGHGRYRIHGPGRALARLSGVTVVDCDAFHRRAGWLCEHADVLVLHGVSTEAHPVVARRRAAGRVTVFEASDNFFDLQVWNPYSAGWRDRDLHDQFWQLAAAADAVQTSTEELAAVWRPAARRVAVFGNELDAVPPLADRPDRPLTVGWVGSVTHLPDWFRTAPVLERWVRGRTGTRLAVMTDSRAEGFVRLPPGRYLFRPAGSWAEYRAFLGELDVGVVPVVPSPFNRGRTDLKFREYAAHGVVAVCADAPPYRDAVAAGETGFLYRTPNELAAALDRLADDPGLRDRVRRAAHAAASRATGGGAERRRDFYLELLGGRARGPALPAEIVGEADADGRYLRLTPAEPERLIAAAGDAAATPALADQVEALFARAPDWSAAGRLLARMWNDLGRHTDALAGAGRVLAAAPDSPGGWVEAARAQLGLGDPTAARYALGRALAANPAHPAAWGLFPRVVTGPEAVAWAARMADARPHSYAAALAAAGFFPPAERAARLRAALERFAPGLAPGERPAAAAAFGRAVAAGIDPADPPPGGLDLLRRAAELFPESAALADRHAEALWRAGEVAVAEAEFARAADLARVGQTYQHDAGAAAGRAFVWQVGEYLRRYGGEGGA